MAMDNFVFCIATCRRGVSWQVLSDQPIGFFSDFRFKQPRYFFEKSIDISFSMHSPLSKVAAGDRRKPYS